MIAIEKINFWTKWIAWGAVGLSVIVYGTFISKFGYHLSGDSQDWGQFGDYVGGVLNPFFGLLTLIAVLTALHVQSKELTEARAALDKQNESIKIQSFELGLFSLIDIHHGNLSSLYLEESSGNKYSARGIFKPLYSRLRDSYESELTVRESPDDFKVLSAAYTRFYKTNEQYIDFYLKYVHQLISYVDFSCPSNHDHYWSILRTQFSDYELLIIYYNTISTISGSVNLPKKDAKFFQSLDESIFLNPHHKDLLGTIK